MSLQGGRGSSRVRARIGGHVTRYRCWYLRQATSHEGSGDHKKKKGSLIISLQGGGVVLEFRDGLGLCS